MDNLGNIILSFYNIIGANDSVEIEFETLNLNILFERDST